MVNKNSKSDLKKPKLKWKIRTTKCFSPGRIKIYFKLKEINKQ